MCKELSLHQVVVVVSLSSFSLSPLTESVLATAARNFSQPQQMRKHSTGHLLTHYLPRLLLSYLTVRETSSGAGSFDGNAHALLRVIAHSVGAEPPLLRADCYNI